MDKKQNINFLIQYKAAQKGDANAQFNLGWMYAEGRGIQQDAKQAMYWHEQAAKQGYGAAQCNLGVMYDKGHGVQQDAKQAVYWYEQAAKQGDAYAQCNLGWMYANGQGVVQDDKQAVYWYEQAVKQGNAKAQNNLGWMYEQGFGVDKDAQKAVAWYQKAAEQKEPYGYMNLAWMYGHGLGVAQNIAKAVEWYYLALDQQALLLATASSEARQRFQALEKLVVDWVKLQPSFSSKAHSDNNNSTIQAIVPKAFLSEKSLSDEILQQASHFIQTKKWVEAEKAYQQLLATPDLALNIKADVQLSLGEVCEQQGKLNEAKQAYKEVLTLSKYGLVDAPLKEAAEVSLGRVKEVLTQSKDEEVTGMEATLVKINKVEISSQPEISLVQSHANLFQLKNNKSLSSDSSLSQKGVKQ